MIENFAIARLPRIEFGSGVFRKLPDLITRYGERVLLVNGARSFQQSEHWSWLQQQLAQRQIEWLCVTVEDEPSPQQIDDIVQQYASADCALVLGIGGGSVLDAAKAIAGLLSVGDSVMDYLEGVGPERAYQGPCVPFIAVPTTAGTGSEATKNAVLSLRGRDGFKKSFRDDKLVAEYALLDPDLLYSCPPDLIAANGMDALTQLMESYTSLRANPVTDALAISGLRAARDSLLFWYQHAAEEAPVTAQARSQMAYASLMSGITLAQAGLGSVHGLASPLGAFFPIPHGVVCGTLVAEATAVNIAAMREREANNPALPRYARVAEILCERRIRDEQEAWLALLDKLHDLTRRMVLPGLAEYGISEQDIPHIVAHSRGSSMKTNPIVLRDEEIATILQRRL